ncbi:MAG: hypothetical protein NZ903_00750 [Candidatus Micrarchaeota archaeon]|nr:hypothetical protein [Candidatus Micrarchaeota archaeon]
MKHQAKKENKKIKKECVPKSSPKIDSIVDKYKGLQSSFSIAISKFDPKKNKVLVVEDFEDYQNLLKGIFSDKEVIIADNFESAKQIIDKEGETLSGVVTDIQYPRTSESYRGEEPCGLELFKYIKKKYPKMQVIVNSSSQQRLEEAKSIGADLVFHKKTIFLEYLRKRMEKSKMQEKKERYNVLLVVNEDKKFDINSTGDYLKLIKYALEESKKKINIDHCTYESALEKFDPNIYTHIVIVAILQDDTLGDVSQFNDEGRGLEDYEAVPFHHGRRMAFGSLAAKTLYETLEKDPDGKTKIIFITYEKLPNEEEYPGITFLKWPLMIEDFRKAFVD